MDALLQTGTSGHVNHEPGSTLSSTFEKLAILFSAAEQVLDCETETIVLRLLLANGCLLYTSPSPRDATLSRMPSSA